MKASTRVMLFVTAVAASLVAANASAAVYSFPGINCNLFVINVGNPTLDGYTYGTQLWNESSSARLAVCPLEYPTANQAMSIELSAGWATTSSCMYCNGIASVTCVYANSLTHVNSSPNATYDYLTFFTGSTGGAGEIQCALPSGQAIYEYQSQTSSP